jgi:hypothetical protein
LRPLYGRTLLVGKRRRSRVWSETVICEDYPCCGHEPNDCDGKKYGSDESIKMKVWEAYARDGYDYGREGEDDR